MSEATVRPFQAEVSQVLRLVVNSLYSNKEIFLRELLSNASDAIDKLRFRSVSAPELLPEGHEFRIRVIPNSENKTLTLSDNGIGMTEEELVKNLGTIAHSGTREFLSKLEQAKGDQSSPQLIGQFGVGFYSAFLVAERVEVTTRAAGATSAFKWTSDAKDSYTIESAERDAPGTDIVLHLTAENEEFLKGYRLRELIARYSDYVGHPIELPTIATEDPKKEPEFERVNRGSALWQRSPKDVTAEQYDEFYKHLSHDWEKPLAHRHFKVEGTQMFSGMVFLPGRAPFDLFDRTSKHGVRLHVKRVFVMDNCEDLLPQYLRFAKGLVDSEDLPLNVSRETLQDNRIVKTIRKQVVSQCLGMIEDLEKERPDDFKKFWSAFGAVLKEGLHFAEDVKERLAKLVRFPSTASAEVTSLADYVSRMKEGQKSIYYATGNSRPVLENSPHLERLRKLGYEVLLMTDPVDPFAVEGISEFDGKSLIDAMEGTLDLDDSTTEEDKAQFEAAKKQAESVVERFQAVLGSRVSEVRSSPRLLESPVCLVTAEGAMAPHIERMMRAQNLDMPSNKRILEINPSHPVIERLRSALQAETDASRIADWIELLYDQALIAEGSPVEDPGAFSKRLTRLFSQSAVA
jgi:molecular chaperone HtpG